MSGINITLSGTNVSQVVFSAPATSSLVGVSGISLSSNGSTVSVFPGAVSRWDNFGQITAAGTAIGNSLVSIQPFRIDSPVVFSNIVFPASINVTSAANNSSAYIDVSISGVLYTRNGGTLSYVTSWSNSLTRSWSSNATGTVTGVKALTATTNAYTLTPGDYWIAVHVSTTNTATGGANTTALGNTVSMILARSIGSAANLIGEWGAQSNNSKGIYSGQGLVSTGATRSTINMTEITNTGTRGFLAPVAFEMRNSTW
jgi:hypothetical protein